MLKNPNFSVIIPVYGCPELLDQLYNRLKKTITEITDNFEIIMINDASPDNSWEHIKKLSDKDNRVKGISLSQNFGQHRAITAGIDYALGKWVIVMDCDLQDQPEEIPKLYSKAKEGYEIVFGKRKVRKDKFFKKLGSMIFYKLYNYFTESNTDGSIANFSIISHKVVREFKKLREQNRSYYLFVNMLGFRKTTIDVDHAKRLEGKSSYTFEKLYKLAIDSIVSQSNKPLKILIKLGFIFAFLSIVYAIWLMTNYFIYSVPIKGWTSLMVSIYFIGGLLFINIGILGLYIGKIFDETKERPLYIIEETTFKENK